MTNDYTQLSNTECYHALVSTPAAQAVWQIRVLFNFDDSQATEAIGNVLIALMPPVESGLSFGERVCLYVAHVSACDAASVLARILSCDRMPDLDDFEATERQFDGW